MDLWKLFGIEAALGNKKFVTLERRRHQQLLRRSTNYARHVQLQTVMAMRREVASSIVRREPEIAKKMLRQKIGPPTSCAGHSATSLPLIKLHTLRHTFSLWRRYQTD